MRGDATLAAVGLAVVVAFALQRARSPFLRIEAEAELAAEAATAAGMRVDDVMALRELIGVLGAVRNCSPGPGTSYRTASGSAARASAESFH